MEDDLSSRGHCDNMRHKRRKAEITHSNSTHTHTHTPNLLLSHRYEYTHAYTQLLIPVETVNSL